MIQRRLSPALLALCAALPLAACGGDSGVETGQQAIDTLQSWNEAECASAHECKATFVAGPMEPTFEMIFGATTAECLMLYEWDAEFLTSVKDAVNNGKIAYDAAMARACLDAFQSPMCTEYWNSYPDSCFEMLNGTVVDGQACTFNIECQSTFCNVDTCAAPPADA